MKSFVVVGLLVSLSSSSFADVTSGRKFASDYPEVIHVIVNPNKTVTFEYCEQRNLTECRLLGNKPEYKIRDLRRKEADLKRQRTDLIASDAAYVVGSALAGLIFTIASPTPVGATGLALYAASGAAGTTVFILKSFIDPTKDGPMAKINAPRTLSEGLLSGQPVEVNLPISDFAAQLDEVLKSIF